ncbi:unnamed protein product [Triticum turgidum subsp. durum]|uniref:MLO-like protein n=1 Tax=Triticum turgidum subsp. durum TaxID=4567 RepID=A0A9R1P9W8_TRITD|nr:unnamed protein product [Triticum turgidum subsp. durum]
MAGGGEGAAGGTGEMRSLALTPTWSVATVLTLLVAASLIVERSIHRLSNWLKKTHRNPLHKAMEKMKEEMMLLGFISLLLAATSRMISGICIDSKYYNSRFSPCTKEEVEDSLSTEHMLTRKRNHIIDAILHRSLRRNLKAQSHQVESCHEGFESFVSHEGLEQLHRFIFVMAVTHVTYSCLTMLLAILKSIHGENGRMKHLEIITNLFPRLRMHQQLEGNHQHLPNPLHSDFGVKIMRSCGCFASSHNLANLLFEPTTLSFARVS